MEIHFFFFLFFFGVRIRECWFGGRGRIFLFEVIHCSSLKDAFARESVHTKKAKNGGYLKVHVSRKG